MHHATARLMADEQKTLRGTRGHARLGLDPPTRLSFYF